MKWFLLGVIAGAILTDIADRVLDIEDELAEMNADMMSVLDLLKGHIEGTDRP